MKWRFGRQLYTQILVCIVVGVAIGLIFGIDPRDVLEIREPLLFAPGPRRPDIR